MFWIFLEILEKVLEIGSIRIGGEEEYIKITQNLQIKDFKTQKI